MAHKFAEIAFTPVVRAIQAEQGSRAGYGRMDEGDDYNHRLSGREAVFIAARDSFYMAVWAKPVGLTSSTAVAPQDL